MRGAVAVYDKSGKRIFYEGGFFTGYTNKGLGENSTWDAHLEKRILKYLEGKGLLAKGNQVIILTNKPNPVCKGANGCFDYVNEEAESRGVGITYRALGRADESFGATHGPLQDHGGDGIRAEDVFESRSGGGNTSALGSGRSGVAGEGGRTTGGGRIGSRLLGGLGILGDLYMLYDGGIRQNPFRPGWRPPPCGPDNSPEPGQVVCTPHPI